MGIHNSQDETLDSARYETPREEDIFMMDMGESFELVETKAFKGHKFWVRDVIKLGKESFATCDDSG